MWQYARSVQRTAVSVAFTWADSFRSKEAMTEYTIEFEQAALLFNIGTLSLSPTHFLAQFHAHTRRHTALGDVGHTP